VLRLVLDGTRDAAARARMPPAMRRGARSAPRDCLMTSARVNDGGTREKSYDTQTLGLRGPCHERTVERMIARGTTPKSPLLRIFRGRAAAASALRTPTAAWCAAPRAPPQGARQPQASHAAAHAHTAPSDAPGAPRAAVPAHAAASCRTASRHDCCPDAAPCREVAAALMLLRRGGARLRAAPHRARPGSALLTWQAGPPRRGGAQVYRRRRRTRAGRQRLRMGRPGAQQPPAPL